MFGILRITNNNTQIIDSMEIKVLGTGCPRCRALEKAVWDALAMLGRSANVSRVEDITQIMEYGIMRTPGLVVNEKVVMSGRVPSLNELKQILSRNQ
jgi:small redox-active disulfide protein 2